MMNISRLTGLALIAFMLGACGGAEQEPAADEPTEAVADELTVSEAELEGNPFRQEWDTPFGVPPFSAIETGHYMPAVKKAVLELREEIDAIANSTEAPTFDNTIIALELAGESLNRVANTFGNITGTDTDDELRALETEIYPMLTREFNAITMNDVLYQRVKSVYDNRESLGLDEQDARLLELSHRGFVRAGAAFEPDVKDKIAAINEELSGLTTKFAQNLLLETKAFTLELKTDEEIAGLSDDFKAAIWNEDKEAWVVGLNRSAYELSLIHISEPTRRATISRMPSSA